MMSRHYLRLLGAIKLAHLHQTTVASMPPKTGSNAAAAEAEVDGDGPAAAHDSFIFVSFFFFLDFFCTSFSGRGWVYICGTYHGGVLRFFFLDISLGLYISCSLVWLLYGQWLPVSSHRTYFALSIRTTLLATSCERQSLHAARSHHIYHPPHVG